jgi:hypothetical protein
MMARAEVLIGPPRADPCALAYWLIDLDGREL